MAPLGRYAELIDIQDPMERWECSFEFELEDYRCIECGTFHDIDGACRTKGIEKDLSNG